jgi:DNA-binding LacI/PurR family transcriptional regulator
MAHTWDNIVFLSHRRGDVSLEDIQQLRRLFDARFGAGATFIDDDFPAPATAQQVIGSRLSTCRLFVPVIGNDWVKGKNEDGSIANKDLYDTEDFVHKELVWAFNSRESGVKVLPILVGRRDDLNLHDPLSWLNNEIAVKLTTLDLLSRDLAVLHKALDDVYDDIKPKPFALVSSTLSYFGTRNQSPEGLDYFVALVTTLVNRLQSERKEAVIKVPELRPNDEDGTVLSQKVLLKEVLDSHSLYRGLIVAPYQVEKLIEPILERRADLKGFPIAFIDKGLAAYASDERLEDFEAIMSVENDGYGNGQLAADCLGEYLQQARLSEANVLVMLGRAGSEVRASGFASRIEAVEESCGIKINCKRSEAMDFTQEAGRSHCLYYFDNPNGISKQFGPTCPHQIHAFFCCNDEIALGVRSALQEKALEVGRQHDPTVVMGFDGIRDMTRMLDGKGADADPYVLNTIDVKVQQQVGKLIQMLMDSIEKRPLRYRFCSYLGERYLNRDDQFRRAQYIIERHSRQAKRRLFPFIGARPSKAQDGKRRLSQR